MVATTIPQSSNWISVRVALKLAPFAKMMGWASIGGSHRSCVSAAMRLASDSSSNMPSVVTTIALGVRSASGSKMLRDRTWLISPAYRNAATIPSATAANRVSHRA